MRKDIPLTAIMQSWGIKRGYVERYSYNDQLGVETIEIVMDRKRRWATDVDCTRDDGVSWLNALVRRTQDLVFIGLVDKKITSKDLDKPLVEVYKAVKPKQVSMREIKAKGLI